MYLVPSGAQVRNRKLAGYYSRRHRTLGVMVMRNGGGNGGGAVLARPAVIDEPVYRTLPAVTTVPTSQIVPAGIRCQLAAPPAGCRYVADATNPCGVKLFCPPQVTAEPTPPALTPRPSATAGTPVPAGFSTNQIFVASNGEQWIYSATQGKWISVGIPYSTGAPGATVSTLPAQATVPAAAPTPALVTTAPAESSYQQVLDWLKEETLISGVPNWLIAVGAGVLLFRAGRSNGGRR